MGSWFNHDTYVGASGVRSLQMRSETSMSFRGLCDRAGLLAILSPENSEAPVPSMTLELPERPHW